MTVQEMTPSAELSVEVQRFEPELAITLDLKNTGPFEKETEPDRVVPFAASLMVRGSITPGTYEPTGTLRTPVQKPTRIQTVRNKVPDVSTDMDISYDQSDPR